MDAAISWIAAFIGENAWFAPLAAFAGGVLTSFTPCSLSGASLAIAYVGGVEQKGTSQSFKLSLVFALGTAVAFCALGIVATAAGSLLGSGGGWLYIILGVLMLAMALQVCGVVEIIPSTYLTSKNTKRGYAGGARHRRARWHLRLSVLHARAYSSARSGGLKREYCLERGHARRVLCRP